MVSKITGIDDDTDEKKAKRRERNEEIGRLLKEGKSKSIEYLNMFDNVLFKKKHKRLRASQKMAILCAVESEKHLLEQVNTGEGKSLIIAAITTIHLKRGKRYVDVITSSPVLAKRDSEEMKEIYEELGLTVSHNCNEDMEERKRAYTCNIVYGDIAGFQRDYLLHSFYKKQIKGDRTQVVVVVDEVDNMLLDNGNNMLYLSHSVPGMDLLDSLLVFIQQQIYMPIYTGGQDNQQQQRFDNETIKRKILADLFGQFTRQDLSSIVPAETTETQLEILYEKIIQNGQV